MESGLTFWNSIWASTWVRAALKARGDSVVVVRKGQSVFFFGSQSNAFYLLHFISGDGGKERKLDPTQCKVDGIGLVLVPALSLFPTF